MLPLLAMSTSAPRISVDEAYDKVSSGEALLICAYDDDEKCLSMAIAGSITRNHFEREKGRIDPDREILLYCA